LKPLLREGFSF